MELNELTEKVKKSLSKFQLAKTEIGKVIVGQTLMVDRLLLALLADGHILIEGLPGLAKTLAVTTLAKVIGCDYKRVQFTPDLLPADLIGTSIYNPKEGNFAIHKGPIFTNILLADEINRAPAKVQAALLEVMQERQVTISGQSFPVNRPYLVLATQNPIEHEGTYVLPEAQTDRFMMKIKVDYPSIQEEKEIMHRMANLQERIAPQPILSGQEILDARSIVNQIHVEEKVLDYILKIVFATRQPEEYQLDLSSLLMYGASPRATIALKILGQAHAYLTGRAYVTPQDIKEIAPDVLRHRLRRSYEAEAENISPDALIERILNAVPVP